MKVTYLYVEAKQAALDNTFRSRAVGLYGRLEKGDKMEKCVEVLGRRAQSLANSLLNLKPLADGRFHSALELKEPEIETEAPSSVISVEIIESEEDESEEKTPVVFVDCAFHQTAFPGTLESCRTGHSLPCPENCKDLQGFEIRTEKKEGSS